MKLRATAFGAAVALASLLACGKPRSAPQNPKSIETTKLTPTELFDLRTKCTEIADKLAETEGLVGAALDSEMLPHYNPEANRCYVQFTATKNFRYVYAANWKGEIVADNYRSVSVYDGRTRELLISAFREGDKSHGLIFTARDTQKEYTTFENAEEEADKLMLDAAGR